MKLNINDILGSVHQGQVYALEDSLVLKVYTQSTNLKTAQAEYAMAEFAADGGVNTPRPHQVYVLNDKTPANSFEHF